MINAEVLDQLSEIVNGASDLNDAEYMRAFWDLYRSVLARQNYANLRVNPDQMQKYISAVHFLKRIADKCGGQVEPCKIDPRARHGDVVAYFEVFDVYGDEIKEFSEIVGNSSAFNIEKTKRGSCINFTIPNIFVKAE